MLEIITDFPLWLLLIWLPISIGLAYWLYKPSTPWLKEVKSWKRVLLLALRSISLFLIGLLLLGVLFETLSVRKEKPILLNLIDNSSSMLNYSDSSEVSNHFFSYLNQLEEELAGFDVKNIFLDDSLVVEGSPLSFQASKTNLYRLIDDTYERYYGKNLGAIQLISDGNFNAGANPLSLSDRFTKIPFYTLGVGDTIRKKDLLVRSILHNEIAFLGNVFPIEVTIEGNLSNNLKTNVKLIKSDEVIASKEVVFSADDFSQLKLEFLVTADAVGFQEYKVLIERVEGESNYENNERSFYVEVIDSRSKILLISGGLHPDIGAIKSVLANDKNLELETTRITEFSGDLTAYDLLIWHEPGQKTPQDFIEKVKKANKPVWYIIGTRCSNETLNQLPLPIIAQFSRQQDNTSALQNNRFGKFELSDDTKRTISKFPPLLSPYGKLQINGPSDILFYQKLGNIAKEEPLFFFGSSTQSKYAVLQGEGLWRWKLANYQLNKNNDAFDEIIKKTVQYLSVRTNTSKLRVNLPKKFYDDEAVTVNATFYNDSYEPITDPTIQFQIINENGEEQKYEFIPSRSEYSLFLGNLEAGKYNWLARTNFEGKDYEKKGAFVVRKVALEALDTRANHNLLYQLAASSNDGAFYLFENRGEVLSSIKNRDDIRTVGYESFSFKNLIDYKWLFFLLIILFAIEWVMRRYFGSY